MKKKTKVIIGMGIFCILSILVSIWYAVTFNDSRLVVPTDFKSYTFQTKDLPMIVSISLTCIYVFALFFIHLANNTKRTAKTNTTRKVNPKWGFLGLLGFLGFTGFWTYQTTGNVFAFLFFLFFGFFGFFYEGKMSGTFMDERFRENAAHAQLKSYKIIFSIIQITLILLCQGKLFGNLEYTLIAAIIILSLTLALGIFLPEYLLYHYDHDDQLNDSEE